MDGSRDSSGGSFLPYSGSGGSGDGGGGGGVQYGNREPSKTHQRTIIVSLLCVDLHQL